MVVRRNVTRATSGPDSASLNATSGASPSFADTHAGFYYSHPILATPSGQSLSTGYFRCAPIWFPRAVTLDRIAVQVSAAGAAGALVRLGIYADTGGRPDALILDAGTVAADGVAEIKEVTISQLLDAGAYWLGAATQVTASTLVSYSAQQARLRGSSSVAFAFAFAQAFGAHTAGATVTGALPASFGTALAVPGNLIPVVAVRVA